jgi:uncharacterized membrane protein YkgB
VSKLEDIKKIDLVIISYLDKYSLAVLKFSLGVVFIWFGALKVFGQSPAAEVVSRTVYWIDPELFVPFLGLWEVTIGVCLLFTALIRLGLLLLAVQMPGTFLPLILLPEICFENVPFDLTLEGQYIIKNMVLIGAAMVVGSKLIPLKR